MKHYSVAKILLQTHFLFTCSSLPEGRRDVYKAKQTFQNLKRRTGSSDSISSDFKHTMLFVVHGIAFAECTQQAKPIHAGLA